MKQVAMEKEKRMTLKEFSEAIGVAYRTVAAYAQKAGWTQNGKITELSEAQQTAILEKMKSKTTGAGFHKREDGSTLHNVIKSIETDLSPVFKLRMIQEQKEALHAQELAVYQAEITRLEATYGWEV